MRDTRKLWSMWTAFLVIVGACSVGASADDRYAGYRSLAEVEAQLAAWAEAHPDLVKVTSIGTSAGGRQIPLVRVAEPGAVAQDERPGVFVGANVAGYHNAGTEAALHLLETLIDGDHSGLLERVSFYVAPVLNPDAHDGLFAAPRQRRSGNATTLDHDRDGLDAEDGCDDLDGDGRITMLRIPDAAGSWLPHPDEPRLMVRADSDKGWVGAFRLESEGRDDDGDGSFNEDPRQGVVVDHNFPHAFPYPEVEAGPWPSSAPETKAILDDLLARRNLALAVVYGPANNLIAMPESLGGSADIGSQKFKLPRFAAGMLGLDPDEEYTIDEVWAVAKDHPFVRRQGITKERMAQFLGAGPATKLEENDLETLKRLAKAYSERLKEAGLDAERPAAQYSAGGFTPWLYYQYGVLALELDVWGIPKAEKKVDGEAEPLTLERLEKMSSEEFLALDEAVVAAFLAEMGAPPQMSAAALMERVRSGQATPEQMAKMARQMGAGKATSGGEDNDAKTERELAVLAWLDAHDPGAVAPWTAVTLPDGRQAEVGGRDPFAEIAPPLEILQPALEAHTAEVLELAGQLARLEITSLGAIDLGGGVYRVEAVVANTGQLATHTQMAVRARCRLPVRLELETGDGAALVTGRAMATAERLDARTGTLEGEWLVRAKPGATLTVRALSENAGADSKTLTVPEGGSR